MTTEFTYNILQYKHSIVSGECVNVGILFYFPYNQTMKFVSGNIQRVKALYPDFDQVIFNAISKGIKNKLEKNNPFESLFFDKSSFNFKDHITTLLLPDSTSLQFSNAFISLNTSGDSEKAIKEYTKLLLPDSQIKKEEEIRHTETFILKNYTDYITNRNINIEHKMSLNTLIQAKGLKLNFELAWKNGVTHLVKPVSFDLKEEKDIQTKSVTFFGYLDLLNDYAKSNNYTFDLLVGKPQNEALYSSYQNALDILYESSAPKEIITEEKLQYYSEETAAELHKKDLQENNYG